MPRYYSNPRPLTDLWDGHEIGDPFLMRFNGQYYLYCSSHGNGSGIKCWVSRDMMDFTYYGYVCQDPRIEGAYAPEVCYVAGQFYMVTSPKGSGHYLLRSAAPLGPFQVISENYGLGIDGSLFVDDDGKEYFYRASAQGIRVHAVPTPDAIDVHSTVIPASFLGHWTEGPMVIKRNHRYYLTNTGNHVLSKGYHVDYFVSHEGPDRGYYALREQQLLLETREEYHALGHSSTCVGPDMDTMYIIYHKNILDEWNRPHHRSMCIDQLFFNGDRMYANACWWQQKAPRLPDCACFDGEGLRLDGDMRYLPKKTKETYTAEVCGTLQNEAGRMVFSKKGKNGLFLTFHQSGAWEARMEDGQQSLAYSGQLPAAVDPKALMCVKVSLREGKLLVYVNQLEILKVKTSLGGGEIGLFRNFLPGFAGFSSVAQDSESSQDEKKVPGVFDACHALETPNTAEGEKNCLAAKVQAGDTLSFPVNVWKTGSYHVLCTVKNTPGPLSGRVNAVPFCAEACGQMDEQGQERRYLGIVPLSAGEQTLKLRLDNDAVLDRIYVLEADQAQPAQIIRDGRDVTDGQLHVIGHKAQRSMIHKFSGFSCAEGYGEAYFGGMYRDYQIKTELYLNPCSPDAAACVYLRSSRESWHPHQVHEGRRAYCVRVLPGRIELSKQAYKERLLCGASLSLAFPARLKLICRVQGNQVTVWQETPRQKVLLLSFMDAMAIPCGRMGLDVSGDGIGFVSAELEPCPVG